MTGYRGRTLDAIREAAELVASLPECERQPRWRLIDIRILAASSRRGWNAADLAATLGGERYIHLQTLGNRALGTGRIEIANAEAGIQRLEYLAAGGILPILMCACAEPEECHRQTVADLLAARGWCVIELDTAWRATPSASAVLHYHPDRRYRYWPPGMPRKEARALSIVAIAAGRH